MLAALAVLDAESTARAGLDDQGRPGLEQGGEPRGGAARRRVRRIVTALAAADELSAEWQVVSRRDGRLTLRRTAVLAPRDGRAAPPAAGAPAGAGPGGEPE